MHFTFHWKPKCSVFKPTCWLCVAR